MSLLELFLLLIIAGIIGSLGQVLAGFELGGCLVSIVVGFIGALLGVWLARELDLPYLFTITIDNNTFPIIWSIIGSALFAVVLGLLTRSRRTAY